MKKINSIDYGYKMLFVCSIFLLFIPIILLVINMALNLSVITICIYVSLGIGCVLSLLFFIYIKIELYQDKKIDRFYSTHIDAMTDQPRDLPGFKKKSMSLPFMNTILWFEHLDGIYHYSDLVIEKFQGDIPEFMRDSMPSQIGFVLSETVVTDEIADMICQTLMNSTKIFRRVCFIGTDRRTERAFKRGLNGSTFAIAFFKDFEKAKEWLQGDGTHL